MGVFMSKVKNLKKEVETIFVPGLNQEVPVDQIFNGNPDVDILDAEYFIVVHRDVKISKNQETEELTRVFSTGHTGAQYINSKGLPQGVFGKQPVHSGWPIDVAKIEDEKARPENLKKYNEEHGANLGDMVYIPVTKEQYLPSYNHMIEEQKSPGSFNVGNDNCNNLVNNAVQKAIPDLTLGKLFTSAQLQDWGQGWFGRLANINIAVQFGTCDTGHQEVVSIFESIDSIAARNKVPKANILEHPVDPSNPDFKTISIFPEKGKCPEDFLPPEKIAELKRLKEEAEELRLAEEADLEQVNDINKIGSYRENTFLKQMEQTHNRANDKLNDLFIIEQKKVATAMEDLRITEQKKTAALIRKVLMEDEQQPKFNAWQAMLEEQAIDKAAELQKEKEIEEKRLLDQAALEKYAEEFSYNPSQESHEALLETINNPYKNYPTLKRIYSRNSNGRTLIEERTYELLLEEISKSIFEPNKGVSIKNMEDQEKVANWILSQQTVEFTAKGISLDDSSYTSSGSFYSLAKKFPWEIRAKESFLEKHKGLSRVEEELLARRLLVEEKAKNIESPLQIELQKDIGESSAGLNESIAVLREKWHKFNGVKKLLLDKIKTKFNTLLEKFKAKIDKDNEEEESNIIKDFKAKTADVEKQLHQKDDATGEECEEIAKRKQAEHDQEADQEYNSLRVSLAPGQSLHYVSTTIQARKQAELDALVAARNAQKATELNNITSSIHKPADEALRLLEKLQAKTNDKYQQLKTIAQKYDEKIPKVIDKIIQEKNTQEILEKGGDIDGILEKHAEAFLQGITAELSTDHF